MAKKKRKTGTGKKATIDTLELDPHNPNRGTERGRALVRESLERFGAGRSVVVDQSDQVVAGNKTVEQAHALGMPIKVVETTGDTLVVVKRTGLESGSDAARGLAIADNRTSELGLDWDAAVLLAEAANLDLPPFFTDDEIAALCAASGEASVEVPAESHRADELREEWGVETGSLWQIGRHRLLCGGATDQAAVERVLGGATPRLCVTDPPYGVDYDPTWRDGAQRTEPVFGDDRADWGEAWKFFPGDVLYHWTAGISCCASLEGIEAAGFRPRSMIIWSKPHFPISRGHYTWQHEVCWYAVRKGATANWIGESTASTVWGVSLDPNVEGGHSTQKPVELMRMAIANHEGDVYEPFAGTGTTILAAEHEGRTCYAIEIEPKFVAVILQRWLAATSERGVRVGG